MNSKEKNKENKEDIREDNKKNNDENNKTDKKEKEKDNKINKNKETNSKKNFIKNIIILQVIIMIYTLSTVAAKFASNEEFLSWKFILFYGIEILILGVYAILWQQIIKKFDISIAYANKAMSLLWSVVWAIVFFKEEITIQNIIGIIIVIIGTLIVNSEDYGKIKTKKSVKEEIEKTKSKTKNIEEKEGIENE